MNNYKELGLKIAESGIKTLILFPTTPWQSTTNYTLKLKKLFSLDRKLRLISPIIITFVAVEAPPPIYNEPI